jgi:hypothetical protein
MPEESELSITFGDQFFESIFQIKPSVKENAVLTTSVQTTKFQLRSRNYDQKVREIKKGEEKVRVGKI